MNLLALIHSVFLKPLFRMLHSTGGSPAQQPLKYYTVRPIALDATKNVASRAVPTGVSTQKPSQPPALRVVRVVDGSQGRNTVGRMVISGRMADVCAELDRLAACEAAG